MHLEVALKNHFGMEGFRRGQKEIIESVLALNDTLAVLPTGGGKSLCYQLPSVVFEGLIVVVSPLIALMKDQVRSLGELGLQAGGIYSGQSLDEKKDVFFRLSKSKQFVLLLSPERVQSEAFKKWFLTAKNLKLVAIDEAHCISQWGPDFRNEYYQLSVLRELRPDIPILALTATATPKVLGDISKSLKLRSPNKYVFGFYRNNIFIEVRETSDDDEKALILETALDATPEGRVIVYCGTRKQAEELSARFNESYLGVGHYHAGLSPENRKQIQEDLSSSKIRILFATNAFGMGIDYPNVRLVVHYSMPSNIESYYQEIGRAGRDGKKSRALLLYSKKDKGLQVFFIQSSDADSFVKSRRWDGLNTFVNFLEGGECRHSGILTYFKDKDRITDCGHCDICDPSGKFVFVKKIKSQLEEFSAKTKSRKNKPEKYLIEQNLGPEAQLRFQKLKEWRLRFSRENDIAAFIVFSDKTLRDLVQKNPKDLAGLNSVYGFGEKKLDWIGKDVLAELAGC